ncbi:MAG: tripartite tricarboxylate transporter TctB family protein [Deltaproteobacteria bacterium]|nr:tripartite tricarboxylate transporter TctB family protein [Deltaproteobacteria bacterium]
MRAAAFMSPGRVVSHLLWLVLGAGVAIGSYRLGLGRVERPGPGFFPFLLGSLFFALALYSFFKGLLGTGEGEVGAGPSLERAIYGKLGLVVAALLGFAFLIEPLGFVPTAFLTLGILFTAAGLRRWWSVTLWSAGVVTTTYFLFTYLGVRFPAGVLRHLSTP